MNYDFRIRQANALLFIIAHTGRRFFFNPLKDCSANRRCAYFYLKKESNKIYYFDEQSRKSFCVHKDLDGVRLADFSHGGTLKNFINQLSKYIRIGEKLNYACCGILDENYWAYGKDAKEIIYKAIELGIMNKPTDKEQPNA